MTKNEKKYVPVSGRGPIGYAWLGHSAPIGFSKEQRAELDRLKQQRTHN